MSDGKEGLMKEIIGVCSTCHERMIVGVPTTYAIGDDPEEIEMDEDEVVAMVEGMTEWMERLDCPMCKTKTLQVTPER
jgi:hypothetical protein